MDTAELRPGLLHRPGAGLHPRGAPGTRAHRRRGGRPAPPCRVDQELTEGDLVDLGGGAAVIGVPGHTDGSIAIHLPAHRILFTRDSAARRPDGRVILGPFNVARESFRLSPEVLGRAGKCGPATIAATLRLAKTSIESLADTERL